MEGITSTAETQKTNYQGITMTQVMYILVSIVFIVFSFWNGLYFEQSSMSAAIYCSLVMFVFLFWIQRNRIRIEKWMLTDYLVFAYFGIAFLSALSPSNVEYAVVGTVRNLSYLLLYLVIRVVSTLDYRKVNVIRGIVLSGLVFALYGLINGFGLLHVNGAIFDPNLRRLASNFEYPNTFAIYESVALILSISLMLLSSSKFSRYVLSIVNYVILTSVVLTYSRGTWIVLAGMLVLLLLLSPKSSRTSVIMMTILPFVALFTTIPILSKAVMESSTILGLLGLCLGIFENIIVIWTAAKLKHTLTAKTLKIAGSVIVLGGVLAFILLMLKNALPQNLIERVASINLQQFSVVQRFVFFKDGLKVITEHPLLGAGPNAWSALWQRYQSYPYTSRQSHSMIIDTIMNVGIIGTVIFLAIIVLIVWTSVKIKKTENEKASILKNALLAAFVGLLIHGFIDFDFSYGTINFLFCTLIALILPSVSVEQKSILSTKHNSSVLQKSIISLGFIGSIAIALTACGYLLSNRYIAEAAKPGKTPVLALQDMKNAISVAPYRAQSWINQAKFQETLYQQRKDPDLPAKIKQSAERAIAIASTDPAILREASGFLGKYGGGFATIDVARRAWENGRYQMQNPEQYMIFANLAGAQLYPSDKNKSKTYFELTLQTYHDVEQRIKNFVNLPPVLRLEYKYDITPAMRLDAAESAFYLGQYDEVKRVLEPITSTGNQKEQEKARILLAAVQAKLNRPIEKEFINLVNQNKDANEYYEYLKIIEPLK